MPLKVELKPNEKIIIGDSVITNGEHRTIFTIAGNAPVLREKDILSPTSAMSPSQKIYCVIQLMYIEENIETYLPIYNEYFAQYLEAAPSAAPIFEAIQTNILDGTLYKALKEAKKLIAHEQERIGNVTRS